MNGSRVAFTGLPRQYQNLKQELLDASDIVLSSGRVLDGDYVGLFEKSIAKRCGRQYAIAVNSCTQAAVFAQGALGIDGKVLVPTQSFVATLNSVIMAGNIPVFCDIDDNALMDINSLDYGLSGSGIKATMYVNLYGNVLNYDRLKTICDFWNPDAPVKIIEDAAQSFGAYYKGRPSGSLGDISILSFDPTKNLPNYGSGGMILTDDAEVASICLSLRDNGKASDHAYAGMSEVDCAQMLVKLKYFDQWQKRRAEIAEYYTDHLSTYVDPILPNTDVVHAWHKYVIRLLHRDSLMAYLDINGIDTKIHYNVPLNEHELGYDYYNPGREEFRVGASHSKESMSLPIYPEMTDSEVEHVVETIKEFFL
jgi:dTDP-4-amino-4,6-dideoxygalactose transaminase